MNAATKYKPGSAPGTFDHRGLWCLKCNDQRPHYRPYSSAEPWKCCSCDHQEGEPVDPAAEPATAAIDTAAVRGFVSAWDALAEKALAGDNSIGVHRELWNEVVAARARIPL